MDPQKQTKIVNFGLQFSSVIQSCLTLCDPMNRSTRGLPVPHQHPEFTQTHVHWVGDAIQASHPLSSPSLPRFNLSQHQGLFSWVSSLHQVAKVLVFSASASVVPVNIQDWFPLGWTGLISLQSKGHSRTLFQYKIKVLKEVLFWPKCSFWFSPNISWKNLKENFGQPNN